MEHQIDELIRDITSAGFMAKSEARRRILGLLSTQRKELAGKIREEIKRDYTWIDEDSGEHVTIDDLNYALTKLLEGEDK